MPQTGYFHEEDFSPNQQIIGINSPVLDESP